MRVGRFVFSFVAASLAAGVVVHAVPTNACINGSLPAEPRARSPVRVALLGPDEQAIAKLIKAEEGVRLGNHLLAATELDAIRWEVEERAHDRVKSRYTRVAALITVRTRGRWPFWVAGTANNSAERDRVLDEAIWALRKRLAAAPDDPVRISDLGEALAGTTGRRLEARRMLESLAAKDLVTSPHAYAALSRLRAQAGDRKGAAAALELCRRLDEKGVACGSNARTGA